MGQKVNPIGLRLGIVKTWESRWYGGKNYAEYILEDYKLRKFIKEKLYHAGVSRELKLNAPPSVCVCGFIPQARELLSVKKAAEISQLKKDIEKMTDREIIDRYPGGPQPEIDAQLVAENVALQIDTTGRVSARDEARRLVRHALRCLWV